LHDGRFVCRPRLIKVIDENANKWSIPISDLLTKVSLLDFSPVLSYHSNSPLLPSFLCSSQVFVRELISNASDALEKLKYKQLTGEVKSEGVDAHLPLEIRISVDDTKKTITIQDTGIGMAKDEMIDFLGRIGHSGTGEFLKLVEKGQAGNLIGQFGVGFYSAFMVSKRIKVYSKSAKSADDRGYVWTSDGYDDEQEQQTTITTTTNVDRLVYC